jgi:hypothetical protein
MYVAAFPARVVECGDSFAAFGQMPDGLLRSCSAINSIRGILFKAR